MRNVLKIVVASAIILIVLPISWYKWTYPTYSWRQKLTVTVDTPEGPISGSAITEVSWTKNIMPEGASWLADFKGEAVLVDLGDRGVLFALLSYSGNEEYIANLATRSIFNTQKSKWGAEAFGRVQRAKDSIGVPRIVYPIFVVFADINDPTTVERVDPSDLAKTFGNGVTLKSVVLDTANKTPTMDRIDQMLTWLGKHPEPKLGPATGRKENIPFYRRVSHGSFIRR